MNELVKTGNQEPVAVEPTGFQLGQWLGRREAFSLIAGRCSAAEIEIVRHIRDARLYEDLHCNWDECCTRHLHASRRSVERELGYLQKYGPAFFTVRQLTHITVREYQSIAAHITEHGVNLDGAVTALHSGNSDQVSAIVEELLKRVGPGQLPSAPEPVPFDKLLKRCQTVVQQLQSFEGSLDAAQRLELADVVAEVRTAAAGLGAAVWDRH
jgi:hypothetical protein